VNNEIVDIIGWHAVFLLLEWAALFALAAVIEYGDKLADRGRSPTPLPTPPGKK
jgi:hypothetical protein